MSDAQQPRPNVGRSAPVGSVDMPAFDENGAPYEIWPCYECLAWHAEIVMAEGEVLLREWHAYDCPLFQRLIADD